MHLLTFATQYICFRPGWGGQTFWPEDQIRDCVATGGPDAERFTWQAAVNAFALLSTVGNVALEKNLLDI